jgi:hypothetical protein
VKKLLAESDCQMQFCEKEVPNACIEELPRSIVKVYNVIYPYTFSKDIFSDLKVCCVPNMTIAKLILCYK